MPHRAEVRFVLILLVLVPLCESSVARAQGAELLVDLNLAPSPGEDLSLFEPVWFAGASYFIRASAPNETQLWKTDGTPGGTERVGEFPLGVFCRRLAPLRNQLIVLCRSGENTEVYTSDGTGEGTVALDVEIRGQHYLEIMFIEEDRLVFLAGDTTLWTTDGTEAETRVWWQSTTTTPKAYALAEGYVVAESDRYYRFADGNKDLLLESEGVTLETNDALFIAYEDSRGRTLTRIDGRNVSEIATDYEWGGSKSTGTSLFLQTGDGVLELAGSSTVVRVFAAEERARSAALVGGGPDYIVLFSRLEGGFFVRLRDGNTRLTSLDFEFAFSGPDEVIAFTPDGVFRLDERGATRLGPRTDLTGLPWIPSDRFMIFDASQIWHPQGEDYAPLLRTGLQDNASSEPYGFVSTTDGRAAAFWARAEDARSLFVTTGAAEETLLALDGLGLDERIITTDRLFFALHRGESRVVILSERGVEDETVFESVRQMSQAGRTVVVAGSVDGQSGLYAVRPGKSPRLLFASGGIGGLTADGETLLFFAHPDPEGPTELLRMQEDGAVQPVTTLTMTAASTILPTGTTVWALGNDQRTLESSSGDLVELEASVRSVSTCAETSLLTHSEGHLILAASGPSAAPDGIFFGTPVCFDGDFFMTGHTEDTGFELFRLAGDQLELAADVVPGEASSVARPLGAVGETLFFIATEPQSGAELYGYRDGQVTKVEGRPGPLSTARRAAGIAEANGWVLFAGYDSEHGDEVWRAPTEALFEARQEGSGDGCGCSSAGGRIPAALLFIGIFLFYARARERRTSSSTDTTSRTRG